MVIPDALRRVPCDHRGVSPARPPLQRQRDGALVAGVASGLARHLGLEPLVVRLVFAALTVAGGAGLLAYAAFWVFVPQVGGDAVPSPGREQLQVPALAALTLGGFLVLHEVFAFPGGSALWPALVIGIGVAIVWQQADDAQRRRWLGANDGSGTALRVAGGVVLLVSGAIAFVATNHELTRTMNGIVAVLVVAAGLVLTFAPWWWRLLNDFTAERRVRIRSQERAEVAAHLHDSVLQTLALIQRRSGSPDEVQRLARSQERELRSWLYSRADELPGGGLAGALEAAAASVEDEHGISVEVVTVGDVSLDEHVEAVVRAAREAMVNAAKFADAGLVAVFAEVEDNGITVFVRDTGKGFEPATVPADRRGLAESIIGRMERHGGVATVRSVPGEGTEVELRLPRALS
ncbi:MAG: PspC domain-containing protein [Acidobacteria bacterium]|nr:PspC domain-containing protein [Acidobacteriota bacterium]